MQIDQNALQLMKSIAAGGGRVTLHDALFDEVATAPWGFALRQALSQRRNPSSPSRRHAGGRSAWQNL